MNAGPMRGEVFVKPTEMRDPIRLKTVFDLAQFIPPNSTIAQPTRKSKLKAAPSPLTIDPNADNDNSSDEEEDMD